MSAPEPNPVFRESFLWYHFDGELAETIRRYGEILSTLACEANALHPDHRLPILFGEVEAVAVDLAQVVEDLGIASRDADSEQPETVKLAGRAVQWAEQLGAVVVEIRGALAGDEDTEADPVARLTDAARQVLTEARERRKLLRGTSPAVDALEDALEAMLA